MSTNNAPEPQRRHNILLRRPDQPVTPAQNVVIWTITLSIAGVVGLVLLVALGLKADW